MMQTRVALSRFQLDYHEASTDCLVIPVLILLHRHQQRSKEPIAKRS